MTAIALATRRMAPGRRDSRPSTPPAYVPRPRVDALLAAATTGPLTLVSAGPGWGKTSAVASWLERQTGSGPGHAHAAWLTLDADDDSPGPFWAAVLDVLRADGAIPKDHGLHHLDPLQGLSGRGLRRLRDGLADLPAPVLLVLDDFHLVRNRDVLASITAVVRTARGLRLLLITRADPMIPLPRLRLDDSLREIRAADLAFDDAEASAFFRSCALAPSDADVRLLVERTEGWAAGLRLAALFLQPRNGRAATAREFAGDDRAVSDYLLDEVLDAQPEPVQAFLLRTAVAERVSPPLAERLTGRVDAGALLDALERSNTFVTALGPHRAWYRYHPMLRDMLCFRFEHADREGFRAAHREAAQWYLADGDAVSALRHAADAQDWDLLAGIVVTAAAFDVLTRHRAAVTAALCRIPDDQLGRTPSLALCAAVRAVALQRLPDVAAHVALAHSLTGPPGGTGEEETACQVLTAILAATASRGSGDLPGIVRSATAGLQALDRGAATFPAAGPYRAILLHHRGVGRLWTGQLGAARTDLDEALSATHAYGVDLVTVGAWGHLALLETMSGRLAAADALSTRALETAEGRGWSHLVQSAPAMVARAALQVLRCAPLRAEATITAVLGGEREAALTLGALVLQSFVALDTGRPDLAAAAVRDARAYADEHGLQGVPRRWLGPAEAEVALARGDPSAALAAIEAGRQGRRPTPDEALCTARVHLAAGHLQAAAAVLTTVRGLELGAVAAVEAWLLTALVDDRHGDDRGAMTAVRRAVERAVPDDIRRPFARDEPRLAALLGRHLATTPGPHDFVDTLLRQGTRVIDLTTAHPDPLVEPLTERELTVLQFLPSLLANAEIASEIFVSVNTVKAHLKSLYRKLGVPNRREAVRRAQQLQLLS